MTAARNRQASWTLVAIIAALAVGCSEKPSTSRGRESAPAPPSTPLDPVSPMPTPANPAALEERVKAHLQTAIALEPCKPKRGEQLTASQTKFGGQPYAERGDTWPICGCGKGLTFIMQANLEECIHGASTDGEDPPLHGQRRSGLFTFFYCHACSSWGDIPPEAKDAWLVRRYSSPSDARAVAIDDRSPKNDRTTPCAVFISPARSLPDWETINELDPALAAAIGKLNDDEPWSAYEAAVERLAGEQPGGRTQIGGYPSFIQGANFPDCPTCRKAMRLLAQSDSEEAAGFMWGDAGSVYLFVGRRGPAR